LIDRRPFAYGWQVHRLARPSADGATRNPG
jgi:hypothetical protein